MLARSAPRRRRRVLPVLLAVLLIVAAYRAFTVEPRPAWAYLQDSPVILAHAGAQGHAPANTKESFQLALQQGADILETDVHMTKDGVLVFSHDDTIDRMSNGTGFIKSMTLQELRQFDFGYDFTPDNGQTFPYRGKGVTIPTVEEVFKNFPGTRVNLEIKQVDPPIEEALWKLIQQYNMQEKVLVNSFHSPAQKRWVELTGGKTAMGANRGHMYEFVAYYLPFLDRLYHPRVDAFQLPVSQNVGPFTIRFDTERLVKVAHRLNMKVHYWTINDEATMRHLLDIGADGIITDYPDRAMKVMKDAGYRK